MKRALISLSDKTGSVSFAKKLVEMGFDILSTGGTKKYLEEHGVPVTPVEDVTNFPEILGGRVKTLHPFIHGGLLADTANDQHVAEMNEHNIPPIQVVCVNLYPFQQTIENPQVSYEDAVENVDIGGPTMLRSAAKNHASVTVVVDPSDYDIVVAEWNESGSTSLETRKRLAAKVFRHTAAYDSIIANYFSKEVGEVFPEKLSFTYEKKQTLRYGENPHQQAAFYKQPLGTSFSIAAATQLHGKELSYNNIQDANAALQIIRDFEQPTAVAVKHMNPCGVATSTTLAHAFDEVVKADPVSIFGGIVALNREVDEDTAEQLQDIFLEIIIAPSFSKEAMERLTRKKNIRLLTLDFSSASSHEWKLVSVEGGLLVQEQDRKTSSQADWKVVTDRTPTEEEYRALALAWNVVKHVKSNAIVLGNETRTIGIGAGQMNRVGAAKIAIEQAAELADGAVLASDAFFPMNDTVELAAKAGIKAIIQPGGSVKDQDSIDMANNYGIAMVMTGTRHFNH
ncbi:bifunctional phosphoribosylaminoimidazolecarboxamide formyltransferase/IMP cyclohydrolase [Paenisporosarcina cavernae]|uniref:Bifunctional purine biosynthesis protein PurH n=1 Tax=Paenisporosarcina cavernae TaxID=2320858 RepID=A0A385YWM6_9BACL|nr:bifunctional phosphoribosylaminoimidazolecarboxamide formyltransferase/IMP cyclohydrolase [Paenisporosarcina cavernae]AYC30307.1 bifunctional phosphoribosylaminoimidazolecarboxamide formyltransferase/IMP cyclohydrolase PurH [Paenisporosarcina cavernae]